LFEPFVVSAPDASDPRTRPSVPDRESRRALHTSPRYLPLHSGRPTSGGEAAKAWASCNATDVTGCCQTQSERYCSLLIAALMLACMEPRELDASAEIRLVEIGWPNGGKEPIELSPGTGHAAAGAGPIG